MVAQLNLPVLFLALSANLALFRSKPNVDGSSKKEPDTGPGKATDGRIDATDLLMHFVTDDTSVDPDPYWFVRLDDMYLVQTVEVFPRKDCCYDTTGTIKVLVGMVQAVRRGRGR